jgi:hypothetical protein
MPFDSNKIQIYFNSVRYLSTQQIYYRIYYFIKRKIFRPQNSNNIKKKIVLHPIELKKSTICFYNSELSALLKNEFTFLNKTICFGEKVNWHASFINQGTRLWKLNLNYHEYLVDIAYLYQSSNDIRYFYFIENHIKEWWNQNPPGTPEYYKDNWNSYAISLRLISWIKIYPTIEKQLTSEFKKRFIISIKDQINFLRKNLEYDIKGNHLIENLFALLFGAYAFNDKKLFKKTKKQLSNELNEQILSDGAHFELSPMYHQIILNRLLDCINLLQNNQRFDDQKELLALMQTKAQKMLAWLNTITFTNGQIPLLNDSAPDIAPKTKQLNRYAAKLNLFDSCSFSESGHLKFGTWNLELRECGYRKFTTPTYECIIDIGQIGPSYQPGHAHADTFNFVLNVKNEPVLVDTGISTYDSGKTRLKERGTAAHNTVTVQNENSSEVWSSFRVARRAKVKILKDDKNNIIAQHDGYKRIGTTHQREWHFSENQIEISDTLTGKFTEGKAHLWFHPSANPRQNNNRITTKNATFAFENEISVKLVPAEIPDGYNRFVKTHKVEIPFKNYLKTFIIVS